MEDGALDGERVITPVGVIAAEVGNLDDAGDAAELRDKLVVLAEDG